jgi:mono/diheme cytochrome c family protein
LSDTFSGIDVNAALRQTISNGVQGSPMPAWSQVNGGPLSDQDIDDIIAYINTWGGGNEPPAPAPTPVPVTPQAIAEVRGDAVHGGQVYAENCVGCHGPRAEGRIGAQLAKNWSGIRPELAIRQTIANGVGATMPAWSQANGGPLSEQDINDVTLYVLSLKPQPQPQPTPTPTGGIGGTTAALVLGLLVIVLIGGMLIFRPGRRG